MFGKRAGDLRMDSALFLQLQNSSVLPWRDNCGRLECMISSGKVQVLFSDDCTQRGSLSFRDIRQRVLRRSRFNSIRSKWCVTSPREKKVYQLVTTVSRSSETSNRQVPSSVHGHDRLLGFRSYYLRPIAQLYPTILITILLYHIYIYILSVYNIHNRECQQYNRT